MVGWGTQLYVLESVIEELEASRGISCELIDLRTILPWDLETILKVQMPQVIMDFMNTYPICSL